MSQTPTAEEDAEVADEQEEVPAEEYSEPIPENTEEEFVDEQTEDIQESEDIEDEYIEEVQEAEEILEEDEEVDTDSAIHLTIQNENTTEESVVEHTDTEAEEEGDAPEPKKAQEKAKASNLTALVSKKQGKKLHTMQTMYLLASLKVTKSHLKLQRSLSHPRKRNLPQSTLEQSQM